jgi:hypothetical protein
MAQHRQHRYSLEPFRSKLYLTMRSRSYFAADEPISVAMGGLVSAFGQRSHTRSVDTDVLLPARSLLQRVVEPLIRTTECHI